MLKLLATLKRLRLTRSENGFTLLELLVVVIVVGLLAGISVPLFLNQQRAAVDATVKSDVRNTVGDVQDWLTRNQHTDVKDANAYADAQGRVTLTRKGDTILGVQVKDGQFTVCGFDAGSSSFKHAEQAWGFDSRTGKFAPVADTMAQPACAGAVDEAGNDISTTTNAPVWSTAALLKRAERTKNYSVALVATGNPAPSYKLATNSTLPDGLTLDETAGVLAGQPTATGRYQFTINAVNSNSASGRRFTLIVDPAATAPEWNTGVALADGQVDKSYKATLEAVGTPEPTYALGADSKLPAGLSLNSTTGVISGTPSAEGDASFDVVATNTQGSVPQTFYLHVVANDGEPTPDDPGDGGTVGGTNPGTGTQPAPGEAIAPEWQTGGSLGSTEQASTYSKQLVAGGTPGATYALATGSSLPAGLKLSAAGIISGTPTAYGDFSFKVIARNSEGSTSRTFALTVTRERVAPAWRTAPALSDGEQGTAYAAELKTTGYPDANYALANGSDLPAGLTLNGITGAISGTPSVFGSFSFTVVARNSEGSASRTFTLELASQRVAPAFTTAATLSGGEQGESYGASVAASGNPAPSYALIDGDALPAGLSLNATTGLISGTPTVNGTFSFTLAASNSKGADQRTFNLTLAKHRVAPAFTTPAQLAAGEQDTAYSATVAAAGEPAPTYALANGSDLPTGLTLNATSGEISGTPSVFGSFSFTVIATNSKGAAERGFVLNLAKHRVAPAFSTPSQLVDGEQGEGYSAALGASGEPAPSFAVAAGSDLPAGLSLSSAGVLTGTPSVAGNFMFTVEATNSKGADSRTFFVYLAPTRVAPAFTTPAMLADGEQATAYSATVAASGVPAVTYAVAAGSTLPTGLSLNTTTGVISGTPTTYGSFTFTVTATNSKGSDNRTFFLYLAQQRVVPAFTTAAQLPDGEQASAYSASIAASGVPAPTYALASGSTLPTGLALDSISGAISGTPSVYGTFSFTLTATNSKGSANRTFTVTLAKQRVTPTFTGATTLPAAEVASAYSATVTASGEPAPTFALASGSNLPAGLNLSSAGVISGTPSANGTFSFDIVATNSKGSATSSFTVAIAKTRVAPAFTTAATLGAGEQNTAYSATVAATGEPAPTYALATGSDLPAGLSLSSAGAISGTPTVYGTFSFSITATNSKGTDSSTFSVTLAKQRVAPTFTTAAALPDAAQNAAYSTAVVATGEPNPTYALTSGALPAGLSLSTAGTISGTPTVYGSFSFTVTATNSKGTGDRAFTLYVARQQVAPAFTTGATLPTAQTGTGYSQTINASGYPDPTYTVTSGALPTGYSLNATTGLLAGNTTAPGSYTFTVKATNTAGSTSQVFTLQVNDYPTIQNANLASGQLDAAYSQTINYTGTPTPTVTVSGLPSGLSYSNGAISGTPTASGSFSVTVSATNSVGTASKTFTLSIAGRAATPTNVRGTKLVGTYVEYAWDAVPGASSYTVTVSGATTDGSTSSFSTTATTASGYVKISTSGSALNVAVVAVQTGYANSTPGTGSISVPGSQLKTNGANLNLNPSCASNIVMVTADCAITSPTGNWTAIMQTDGNFVVYNINTSTTATKAYFATSSYSPGAFLSMQIDTNLLVYRPGYSVVAATNTSAGSPGATLFLQSDGNLIVTRNSDGAAVWLSIDNGNPNSNTAFLYWVAGSNVAGNNYSAENDDTSTNRWSTYFSPDAAFTTEDKHDGNRSWKVYTQARGGWPEGFINGVNVNVNPGERIFATIWVKGTAGESWSIAGREENQYNEGMGAFNLVTNGQWQQITMYYTTTYTSTQVNIQARQNTPGAGKTLYSDQLSIYRGYP